MAKERMICPFSERVCEECALYRGRHYYLCYCRQYRGYLDGPGKLAREDFVFVPGARSSGVFEIPPMIRARALDPFVTNYENHQEEVQLTMLMEGKLTLHGAPAQEVWDFLLKPETLLSCVPGAEKMEAIDDKTYESIVSQKVGPVVARFEFTTILKELDPPRYLKAVGRGADLNKNGTFTQETTVNLVEISKDCVEISYRSHVNIVGRLATSGDRIMRAKAKELEQELTNNLQERLKSQVATGTNA